MYELFAFANDLNPILQGVLIGLVAFLAVLLFRGFYLWLTGANLLLEELKELNTNLKDIKAVQTKTLKFNEESTCLQRLLTTSLLKFNTTLKEPLIFGKVK